MQRFLDNLVDYLPHIIAALIIYIGGLIAMKIVIKLMNKGMNVKHVDKTLHRFITSVVHVCMMILILVMVLSALQVSTSSIIAAIGAAGLAIGLALQNSLSNVAGGFIILLTKTFKIGDYISINGVEGFVEAISILQTTILTMENKRVSIPNKMVTESIVTNFTAMQKRRLELRFNIAYEDDHKKAMSVILSILGAHPDIINDPDDPMCVMEAHADSSIVLLMRAWLPTEKYWATRYDVIQQVKEEFDRCGITIPYNQVDMHIKNS
ncbi:MAG: mechanosensitive ion channel family protein [Ruminococcus sp.]|nr:mechanosensitive ion channel family protein [Ruminococcus sp.]